MKSFVLDCSVTMEWGFDDEGSSYSDAVLNSLAENEAMVPSLWFYEVCNVLAMAEKRKRFNAADSSHFIGLLSQLPITIAESPAGMQEILNLARQCGLTSYDAAYIELCMRTGLPLATFDADLKRAANHCGIKPYSV